MSDVLTRICDDKLVHIADCKAKRPLGDVESAAKSASTPRGFIAALERTVAAGNYGLIAEIKKASPSKGLIRADFAPASLAKAYEAGGATCLSVLTDVPYFQGNDIYLGEARGAVALPVLRKDFMLDPYQVVEARALGADCILLIMAAVTDSQAAELEQTAFDYGMDVLVEVHNDEELTRALKLKSPLIGVNNRNLKTLEVDIAMTEELAPRLPDGRILVSESGLYNPDDLSRMARAGASCFLIGESLMRQDDVETAVRTILAKA
jgi:indole-3-glycerol phosphate synthase